MVYKTSYKKSKAMTVKKIATQVKSLLKVERKRADVTATLTPNATGTINHLSQVSQGSGSSQRNGNTIKSEYLTFKALWVPNASATNCLTTVMIVRDNQQRSDAVPAVSDVIDSLNYGSLAVPNATNKGRFSTLYKRKITQDGGNPVSIDTNIKLGPVIKYNGSATSDIEKGGIYIIAISNQITNTPNFQYVSLLNYSDA